MSRRTVTLHLTREEFLLLDDAVYGKLIEAADMADMYEWPKYAKRHQLLKEISRQLVDQYTQYEEGTQ